MANENTQNQEPFFSMQRVYLKDASLELPNAPQVFLEQESPEMEINVSVSSQNVDQDIYEVTTRVTLTGRIKEKVLILVEAEQAGVFTLGGMPAEQVDPLLNIVCPTMIFPYLRSNVADLMTRASLPPMHLADINFQALYEANQAKSTQQTQ